MPVFSVAFVLSAVFALVFNYTIQNSIRGDVIVLDQYLFTGASLFQIIVFFMIFMALYLIFNHFLLPTILITSGALPPFFRRDGPYVLAFALDRSAIAVS